MPEIDNILTMPDYLSIVYFHPDIMQAYYTRSFKVRNKNHWL